MTNLIVKKASLNGEIIAPSSKSVAHRMIIASAISGAKVQVFGNLNSKDIQATLDCMQVVGA
ncbi:MAG: 3-phosphoshikimate 1-carboxyvinyltransferase, partial [Clostridia bacterium]|nr:3-phosphoshikimate 1-carboxyvinyltransferase [Clostridia bacterium]